jgi:DNA-binding NarL/FixJ family response regulator
MKTIFLAEGEKHVRDALHLLLEQHPKFKVTGDARSVESLLAQVCQQTPDAILLDWTLPGLHPQRLIRALRECCPHSKLVAISVKPEHEKAAQEYCLDGFILKQQPETFLASLEAMMDKKENQ